jgi:hypothetical protein
MNALEKPYIEGYKILSSHPVTFRVEEPSEGLANVVLQAQKVCELQYTIMGEVNIAVRVGNITFRFKLKLSLLILSYKVVGIHR